MLLYLFDYLQEIDFPGARLMDYLTFRSGTALVLSLLITLFIGRRIIERLQLMQIGEIIRNLDLEGQQQKKGTPTMGGIIIIIATLVPCLLIGDLSNIYMLLMLGSMLWLGVLGFLDDYIKIARKNKDGLKGKFKIAGQVGLGLIVGVTMYLSPDMVMRENHEVISTDADGKVEVVYDSQEVKALQTTIPFVKNNNLDYAWFTQWMGDWATPAAWILFILVTIFMVTATSNGANLTDGLDGLAAGTSTIAAVTLAIIAYLGGNVIYSSYLNIMYLPGTGELVVFMAAFVGALIGFLWYNAHPAQVFMGDTGSLTIGGIIAVFAILIHKELLLVILCALFYIEDFSVLVQTTIFRLTKKNGQGKRIFKMAPLHHHFQKPGNGEIEALIQWPKKPIPESKIVIRFWILAIFLAVMTIATLKIR
ncbi:MAG: phospho-N-acetylmuramoyl-pentapeptide-transferase [Muribaculaceae bacterium]|nr:phospho-N-acetylmuramoyl-pentapeptide-transferase [Muribaculaceae bacterium]